MQQQDRRAAILHKRLPHKRLMAFIACSIVSAWRRVGRRTRALYFSRLQWARMSSYSTYKYTLCLSAAGWHTYILNICCILIAFKCCGFLFLFFCCALFSSNLVIPVVEL
ncbi:unnamed protein product [Ceratitis capitata]|uniref:(Mediterranean fruit fly) hypothetical protein n=1 Tax=Ceratitis capitata TaxID=7213 RepID=A0A811UU12_CERCA|nr:unnamed protein product [Ceratitis capitata]